MSAGLGERQITQLVEHDEVEPGQVVRHAPGTTGPRLRLQAVHQVDDVEEPAAGTVADACSRDGNGQMGFAGTRAADQDDIALMGKEAAAGAVTDQGLVDRSKS